MPGSKPHTFWQVMDRHVVVRPTSGCWVWTGHRNKKGYGWRHGGAAHRWFWKQRRGPIPEGMTIDHTCFNKACVNPDHLRLLSLSDNSRNQRQPLRIVCQSGRHPLSGDNVKVTKRGRACRACAREAERKRRNPTGKLPSHLRTHCPQGHPYDEENTYTDKTGRRHCRACARERARKSDG